MMVKFILCYRVKVCSQTSRACPEEGQRCFQYTVNIFKNKIEESEITQSILRVGKYIDNDLMEGFFYILKSEMFHGKKFKSLEVLAEKIVDYIEFYYERRFQKN